MSGDVTVQNARFSRAESHHRLVGLDGCFQLGDLRLQGVGILRRAGAQRRKLAGTTKVEARIRQLRLVLGLIGLCLVELRLEWPWIDLRQHVTCVHVLALGECDAIQLTIDADLHGDHVDRLHRTDTRKPNRHVARRRSAGRDRNCGWPQLPPGADHEWLPQYKP